MRRASYCTRAPPIGPCDTEKIATGLSCHDWLGGREAQSIAFLSAALREKLYSGLAISTPSAAVTSARKRLADSGRPVSNTSWLKIGRSSIRANVIVMPCGISSAHVFNAAVLNEALRRLPLMPRIFRSATRRSRGKKREFTVRGHETCRAAAHEAYGHRTCRGDRRVQLHGARGVARRSA